MEDRKELRSACQRAAAPRSDNGKRHNNSMWFIMAAAGPQL